MSYTFELGGELNTTKDNRTINVPEQIIKQIGGDVEQVCVLSRSLINNCISNLVGLAHYSFATHRHMILDPDSVWITIEHGLATHIKANSEELRHHFVNFDGKRTIEIVRNHFIRGSQNDWEGCFDEFSEKIGEFIGPQKDLIVGKYSTTGTLQRVSSEIVLMDAMSNYFNYMCTTMCHIPMITIMGTVEDWENIREKANSFDVFGLSWWTDYLKPVLDEFIKAAKGNFSPSFWKSWYKEGGGSGGPFITGHVNALFPYVGSNNERNKCMGTSGYGNTTSSFNQSLSKVPFIWNYYDTTYPMEFAGGIIGISQDDAGSVRCEFGWAVRDESVPLKNYALEKLTKNMVIHHKDGRRGLLKKADVEEWDYKPGCKELCEIKVLWDGGKLETYDKWQIKNLIVKEAVSYVSSVSEAK